MYVDYFRPCCSLLYKNKIFIESNKDQLRDFVGGGYEAEKIELCAKICKVLMETDFTTYDVKYYLSNKKLKYTDISVLLNVNYNTLKNRIRILNNKIDRHFPDVVNILKERCPKSDIDDLNHKVNIFLSKYKDRKPDINEYIVVPFAYSDIFENNTEEWGDISDNEFDKLCEFLKAISKKRLLQISDSIEQKSKRYLSYLFNNISYLSDADLRRATRVHDILTN